MRWIVGLDVYQDFMILCFLQGSLLKNIDIQEFINLKFEYNVICYRYFNDFKILSLLDLYRKEIGRYRENEIL